MNSLYKKIVYGIVIPGSILATGLLAEHIINRGTNIPSPTPAQQAATITADNFRYLIRSIDGKGYEAIDFVDYKNGERVTGVGSGGLILLETQVSGIGNLKYFSKIGSPELEEVMIGKGDGTIERINPQNNEWKFYSGEYERLFQAAVASERSKQSTSLADRLRNLF